LADITMRATPPVLKKTPAGPPTPDYADLSRPAEERIRLASRRCFTNYGIHVPLAAIAELAESNLATAIRYYESQSHLVHSYVQELLNENEKDWKRIEAEHPKQPEAQLRSWIKGIGLRTSDAYDEESMLARATAQLFGLDSSPLLKEVRLHRMRELRRVYNLCRDADFDEPSSLANKLILLVDGARTNNNSFIYPPPNSHLYEAAGDLMEIHRGGGKLRSPLD
jgi:AcrR family transcriptional regulator